MKESLNTNEYKNWLYDLKLKIKQSQIKASLSVNSELIMLYWDLGKQIIEKQEKSRWGSGFIDQLSKDLKTEFPEMSGFSRSNLFAMRKFYLFCNQIDIIVHQLDGQIENETKIVHQADGQIHYPEFLTLCCKIPWQHNILIIEKIKNITEAFFYINETIANSWSRSILEYQIETNLYNRQGKAITNFKNTLPTIESDLANALLKDPYNFEFLTLSSEVKELELEQKLVQHITQFLLELGKGFAYMGRQFQIIVGGKEFRTDLLFYHTKLKCHVIIEFKVKEFEPEFLGKLNFYLTAINELVKSADDKPTIGILLCKNKNDVIVDFSLKDINKPMGVSQFTYRELPAEIKNALPSLEELTQQFNID
ncbi:MAG TPA: PDDEXK nuclease domain-containing protein [Paludibacter sp.]|nr:PDDEXK nuclease domain-containing protein [Paludibacter sp.]